MGRHKFMIWLVLGVVVPFALGCRSTSSRNAEEPRAQETWWAREDRTTADIAAAQAHYGAGVIHEMNGEVDRAVQEYQKAALQDSRNEWLVLEVSRRLLQHKKPEMALEVLTRAASRPGASGALLARLGQVYAQLGKLEDAINVSRLAIRRSPRVLTGYQTLFVTYIQQKLPVKALQVLDEAASQPKTEAEFLAGLSELYASYGVHAPAERKAANEKALQVLKRAESLTIDNPALKLKIADGFALFGDSERAVKMYHDLLKALPNAPAVREHVHTKLANIYLRGSDHKRAVEQLQGILQDDPTNPQAHYFLGSIAGDEDKPAEAADHLSKAILLSPEFEQAYYELANAQLRLDRTNEAIATLERARDKFQENFVMEMLTGVAFSRIKDYDRAIRHYTAAEVMAKATDPKRLNQAFYFQVGAAYERRGDFEEAEKYFEKSLQLAPDFAEAQNYLGYMWAERGVKLEQARELVEKAVKAQPDNGAYLDSLGWVLFKLNQPKEALKLILKAVDLTKEPDPTLFDHLGDIYAALGQTEKARDAWQKALKLEPNEKISRKLQSEATADKQ